MKYSLIVPAYNEQETLDIFYKEATRVLGGLNESYEIIFIDDGSTDKTADILNALCGADKNVKAIRLSRNFGHQNAVTAGLDYARGEAAIIIDCDLQDPVSVVTQLIDKWKQGYNIVYGRRVKRRGETAFKRGAAYLYYRLLRRYYGALSVDAGDFRLLDRRVIEVFKSCKEKHRFLRGLSGFAGFKTAGVDYVREARRAGKTKYSLRKMSRLAADGVFANTSKPLFFGFKTGLLFLFLGGAGLLTLLTLSVLSLLSVVPPVDVGLYILSAVCFGAGILIVNNCIQGAYIARIYDEVKDRPNYIIESKSNFE